jgi:hypothetical protein
MEWTGETEVLEEILPQSHFVYHKSHTTRDWNRANEVGGRRVNRLSYGTAPTDVTAVPLRPPAPRVCKLWINHSKHWYCITRNSTHFIYLVYKHYRIIVQVTNQLKVYGYIFWGITPCSPSEVNWRFRGTYRFHRQGRNISHARNKREADNKQRHFRPH